MSYVHVPVNTEHEMKMCLLHIMLHGGVKVTIQPPLMPWESDRSKENAPLWKMEK